MSTLHQALHRIVLFHPHSCQGQQVTDVHLSKVKGTEALRGKWARVHAQWGSGSPQRTLGYKATSGPSHCPGVWDQVPIGILCPIMGNFSWNRDSSPKRGSYCQTRVDGIRQAKSTGLCRSVVCARMCVCAHMCTCETSKSQHSRHSPHPPQSSVSFRIVALT